MSTIGTYFVGAAVAILVISLVKKYIHWRIFVNKLNRIPGPKHQWIFGIARLYIFAKYEDFMEIYQGLTEEYAKRGEPLMRAWIFNVPYVGIASPEAAEVLLRSTSEISKTEDYNLLRPWLGLGLLTSTGQKWHSHRKLLTPSFHFQILENFVSVFNEQSQILVDQMEKCAGKGSFDISNYIKKCTLDIICDSAMGRKVHAQTQPESKYVNAVVSLSDIIFKKFIYIWRTVPAIYYFFPDKRREDECLKTILDFTNEVIQERQAERARHRSVSSSNSKVNNNSVYGIKERTAFLDTLLEAIENGQGYMSNEEIREEVDTFMFEGHDTTASGLLSAIMNLALHQDVQKQAQEEIESIFGDSNRPVEMSDFPKMKYLEGIIKETLRMYPPVPFYGRTLKEDLVVEGYTVPKGSRLVINLKAIHRNPKVYKDPNTFDPTRFLKHNDQETRHPYSFLAFSAGARNCIGQKFALMEEKVVLTYILRNYVISGTWTEKQAKMSLSLVSRPIRGLQVSLTKRH